MRKVEIELTVKLFMRMDEGIEVEKVLSEMDYNFTFNTPGVAVDDSGICDHKVVDIS